MAEKLAPSPALDALLSALRNPPAPAADATSALLDVLRRLAAANNGAPADPAAAAGFNAVLRAAAFAPFLGAGGSVKMRFTGGAGPERLAAIALDAMLAGTWVRVKTCADPGCRALYYDGSKNGSRRWCSMARCGSRAKMRAFRRERRR